MKEVSKAYIKQVQGKGYTCVRQLTKAELTLLEAEQRREKKKEKELACFVPHSRRRTDCFIFTYVCKKE